MSQKTFSFKSISSGILLIGCSIVISLLCIKQAHLSKTLIDTPFVLIEIRALDQGSHPIAGAIVTQNGNEIGVTDAFGELRKFLQVPFGSDVQIKIIKKKSNGILKAEKNLTIPTTYAEKGELKMNATLHLIKIKV